jgi:hypothetical protein
MLIHNAKAIVLFLVAAYATSERIRRAASQQAGNDADVRVLRLVQENQDLQLQLVILRKCNGELNAGLIAREGLDEIISRELASQTMEMEEMKKQLHMMEASSSWVNEADGAMTRDHLESLCDQYEKKILELTDKLSECHTRLSHTGSWDINTAFNISPPPPHRTRSAPGKRYTASHPGRLITIGESPPP